MSTPAELVATGRLIRIDVPLLPGEQSFRRLFGTPQVAKWLKETLPGIRSDGFVPGAATPREQALALFRSFIRGDALDTMPPKCMTPTEEGVWELRTSDLRFFGWFWRPGTFIASAADTKERCLRHRLYAGYRGQTARERRNLQLDPPTFVPGSNTDDVL